MQIRLTHIDGKLPNLALMKLSHWYKSQGGTVHFTRSVKRGIFEPDYDHVYGSTIFAFSRQRHDLFVTQFPQAIIGGTGSRSAQTVEVIIGGEYEKYDYSIYPDYRWSLGFTQRGCRLNCKFCVVPTKEGKPRSVNSIDAIWRGDNHPKNIVLLDNDFFGQDKQQYLERIQEIIEGGFKVSFNQGINIRLIDDDVAYWLAKLPYYDHKFKRRVLYTAWDNLKDEQIFFQGVDRLEKAGVPSRHLMTYMLVGYRPDETMEEILYRFWKMVERDIKPYPMVFNNADPTLKRFQRWAVRRYYEICSWEDYDQSKRNRNKRNKKSLPVAHQLKLALSDKPTE